MATEIDPAQPDRRKRRRFQVALELRYKLLSGRTGRGELVNISSHGLLLRSEAQLPRGELIQVDLAWPFRLENGRPLELRVHGLIVRSDAAGAALTISKYEIRAAP